ncbi:MAG: hypothetical protein ABJP34_13110 [Erythrobacter sp.]
MRQGLHLDPIAGFSALTQISANASDELSIPAAALREHLLESHPQLIEIEQT